MRRWIELVAVVLCFVSAGSLQVTVDTVIRWHQERWTGWDSMATWLGLVVFFGFELVLWFWRRP